MMRFANDNKANALTLRNVMEMSDAKARHDGGRPMTPETLLLIAQLATGDHQWQPMDSSLCAMVVEYTDRGFPVTGDKADGSGTVTIVKAACIEDNVMNRLELIFGSDVGACEAGV